MLKVNVGFSRKVSRDYNSTGFSVNLEGEILAPLNDPEMVVGKIQELYDLAEESLNQQIERYESESAIAQRDVVASTTPPPERQARSNGNGQSYVNGTPQNRLPETSEHSNDRNGDGSPAATNKQIQFLLNLGKRHGLTTPQLEQRVVAIIGRQVGLYDLTKQEAGKVLDALTAENGTKTARRR